MRSALLSLLLLAPLPVRGAQALVVLSEPLSPPFREALEGLRAEWPQPLEIVSGGGPLPPGPHGVIIAFGGRAAAAARQAGAPMVVALAPSFRAEGQGPATVFVAMTPSPERMVKLLAAAGVRRLLAVRAVPAEAEFSRRAAAAGSSAGVGIEDAILPSPDRLPGLLRGAGRQADAIWLAPDPATVTPETFGAAREYSRARGIPFFAPAPGLVRDEIHGELSVSYRECGREAARAARKLQSGLPVEKVVYPP